MQRKYFQSGITLVAIILMLLSMIGVSTQVAHAAPIRIAAIGDSITAGAGTSNPPTTSYPAQLQTLLGSTSYTVGNYGHSGATMLKQGDTPYWNTQEYIDSGNFLPDVVVIMLGTNDSKSWNWQYKSAYVSDYTDMIAHYRGLSSHPTVYINLSPPAFSTAYGIDGAVIQNELVPMIRQVSTNTGAPIIDVNAPLLNSSSLFPDGVHPNDQGAYQIANIVYNGVTGHPVPTSTPIGPRSAFSQIEAEIYTTQSGTQLETCSDTGGGQDVGWADTGDYIVYNNIDFGSGASGVNLRFASANSGGTIEFHLGSTTGTLIASFTNLQSTGGWQTWSTLSSSASSVSGMQNLYVVFNNLSGIGNLNWFQFTGSASASATPTQTKTKTPTPTATTVLLTATRTPTLGASSTSAGPTATQTHTSTLVVPTATQTRTKTPSPTATSGGTIYYKIVNRLSGKVLDVTNNSATNGARIQQWDYAGGTNQQWSRVDVGGGYFKILARSDGKALDVVDNSAANGAQIQQWDYSGNLNQQWQFVDLGGGYFKIIVRSTGKALDDTNNSTSNGTLVQQWDYSGGANQQWSLVQVP